MTSQRNDLIAAVRDLGGGSGTSATVDLETFFTENHDPASIAPNLVEHPGPQAIYEVLRTVRERPNVPSVEVLV